ncbi:hypothetical protein J32TS6_38440 [Virgibacillus pantothenticus]|uniref:Uncharacterized protein n=1 Tax=Virgibacillus pantothenticus TaxID=1473 RepID=A0A0L0QMT8_VIRPA|nr:hypothetical protein [Virgibacillus pantothenticus]KNE19834.1 hypothetical protein AFK71_15555 [Virgibacillus pantothenticus]MBU8566349.1 hypothetical protein [Virgibacillus pantothenticus]MBU8600772.1 hypothetical protein [Virgibacillus pantothenticus]MBU8634520.1 hypothetical protein [Virgibacillus pantothenticus]MBU8640880.1 hypothetical protein [Virgibacillus pantothenticus]
MSCKECYSDNPYATPMLRPRECLEKHTQYICGTCGRCICIERDEKRGLRRWNFPFKSLKIEKLYVRTAEYTAQRKCFIYEIISKSGRKSYKIFSAPSELEEYLKKNKNKMCSGNKPIWSSDEYIDYPNTQFKKLKENELEVYLKHVLDNK